MKKMIDLIKRYSYGIILSCIAVAMSCTSEFEDINTNPNAIAKLGDSELPFLFSKAQQVATHYVWTYQVAQNLFADQYAQYFACTATYFPSDRLVIRQDWVGAAFNPIYTDVVPQLQTLMAETDPASAENAIAKVWWVYSFHRVTDYWGPIPYSQAGVPATSVEYDTQASIYADFFVKLDEAIAVLNTKKGTNAFASFDLIYGGSVDKWIKFANTLKLRLAMRISKVDATKARAEAEEAVGSGVMSASPTDDALIQRSLKGADFNGLSVMSDWGEFRMSAAMESVLKGYEDPRMGVYFQPALNNGVYNGLRNGLTADQLANNAINYPDNNSHVGERWTSVNIKLKGKADHNATPQNVMCSAEAWFLRAEGALLGWNMGTTAQIAYESGIEASMSQWDIKDTPVIAAYKTSVKTPIAPNDFLNSPALTNIPVAFGATPSVQLEQIMTQKWLALYPEGMEAWADYRRSKVLKLYPVANSENSDITNTSTQWIRRIVFLTSERQNNTTAVKAAEGLLGGPDKVTTPLWWDKN